MLSFSLSEQVHLIELVAALEIGTPDAIISISVLPLFRALIGLQLDRLRLACCPLRVDKSVLSERQQQQWVNGRIAVDSVKSLVGSVWYKIGFRHCGKSS